MKNLTISGPVTRLSRLNQRIESTDEALTVTVLLKNRDDSILKTIMAFLDYQDSNAGKERKVVQQSIPEKLDTIRMGPWCKNSSL